MSNLSGLDSAGDLHHQGHALELHKLTIMVLLLLGCQGICDLHCQGPASDTTELTILLLCLSGLEGAGDMQDSGVPGAGADAGVCSHAGAGRLLCAGSAWPHPGPEACQGCQGQLGHHQGVT